MAQQRSRNYTVLHKNRARLVEKAKDCLQQLTDAAFQRDLISEETKKECRNETLPTDGRAQALVDALLERVGEEDGYFDVLVQVLGRIPALAHLSNQLEDESRKEIEGFKVPSTSEGGGQGNLKLLQDGTDLDSGIDASGLVSQSAPEAPSVPHGVSPLESLQQNGLNGDAATEHGVLETTSATFDDSELVECMDSADTCEDGKRCEYTSDDSPLGPIQSVARHPASIEEVGRAASNESIVTSSSGFLTQLSMTSSVSSTDEAIHNLRMEVSQQKSAVTDCQAQVTGLTQRLERTTQEKLQALSQLKNKEDEVKRITERKDAEIQELLSQIESKEREVACYQHRIADKEKENEELKQQHEVVVKALVEQKDTVEMEIVEIKINYEEKLKKMEQKLKTANARREEAVLELAAVRISLAEKEAEYNRMLWIHEKEISCLKLRVAEQIATEQTMKADLAECRLTIEKLKRRSVEKKHRDSLSKVKELESGQQETEEKLRESEAKQRQSEKERQDAQQKHRDSLSKVEELESELARLRLNAVPEDQSHN